MDRFDEMYDPRVHRATPPKKRKDPLDEFEDVVIEDDEEVDEFIK